MGKKDGSLHSTDLKRGKKLENERAERLDEVGITEFEEMPF
jgi:hypothetical protein